LAVVGGRWLRPPPLRRKKPEMIWHGNTGKSLIRDRVTTEKKRGGTGMGLGVFFLVLGVWGKGFQGKEKRGGADSRIILGSSKGREKSAPKVR